MIRKNLLPLLSILALLLQSCQSDALKESGWSPQILAPLATTTIDFRDLSALNGLKGTYQIPADELEIPDFVYNQPLDVPPIGPFFLPPVYLRLSEVVRSLEVAEAGISLSITNIFPIPIGAGTEIACRDSASGALIFSYTLPAEVAPGASLEIPFSLIEQEIPAVMSFGMENFRSRGGSQVVFSPQPMEIQASIQVLNLKRANLRNNLDIEFLETVNDFSLNLEKLQDTSALDGSLNLFIEHRFPAKVELQLIFTDKDDQPVFSLFENEEEQTLVLEPAPVDAEGRVIGAVKKEILGLIHLKPDLNLLAQATKIKVYARLSTPASPATVVVDQESRIELSLTGKLSLDASNLGE